MKTGVISKAYAISDAKISFVSLVDKAANQREFLITKAENGNAEFAYNGRIIKMDDETHYITGVVYEPLTEDTHGNYMTAEEIQKSAYWFAKNGNEIDLQHNFEAVEKAAVVENYIAPVDMNIGEETIQKGSWIMTVEIENVEIWDAVQKGELTGFSMGGVGKYSVEDIDLDSIQKEDKTEKGIIKKLAGMMGYELVKKGEFKEIYTRSNKNSSFWNAFYTLEDMLYGYNWNTDQYEFKADESTIKEVLEEFSQVMIDLLTEESITKALEREMPVIKAGKKISSDNLKKLNEAYDYLTELRENLADSEEETIEKEDVDVTKVELEEMIEKAVTKAVETIQKQDGAGASQEPEGDPTPDAVETITKEDVQELIDTAIQKAVEPILKAQGLPSNLNDEGEPVKKSDQHYLAGIL